MLACDAIHLTGGNTFRFLHWLREHGRTDDLRRYALDGGVLAGVTAGAILMTPEMGASLLCEDASYQGSDRGGGGGDGTRGLRVRAALRRLGTDDGRAAGVLERVGLIGNVVRARSGGLLEARTS